ncbi:MAG: M67 family metallopeptidase [Chloroflexi bacterium]|nr:M67 family metallopeptidase [Chloroflexota bacterium]
MVNPSGRQDALQVERHYVEAMIAQAQAESPLECCGIIAGRDGRVAKLFPAANAEKSPVRYSISPQELFSIYEEIEAKGWELLGIYHSHTKSEAYPSATDVELAFWPDSYYLIISLKDPARPVIRAYRIVESTISEVALRPIA